MTTSHLPNVLLETIRSKSVALSLTLKSSRSLEIIPIAKTSGYHGIFIDGEHAMYDLETISNFCIAAIGYEISPIVRVPGVDPGFITKVLDSGAQAIVVPHVDTKQQALECVKASKYHPIGKRSIASGFPQFMYKPVKYSEFSTILNREQLLFPMIETQEALENVDEIVSVEGVDGILIGSSDFSADLGDPLNFTNPKYLQACKQVIDACKANNKLIGIGGIQNSPETIKYFVSLGVNWFLGAQDSSNLAVETRSLASVLCSAVSA